MPRKEGGAPLFNNFQGFPVLVKIDIELGIVVLVQWKEIEGSGISRKANDMFAELYAQLLV